MATQVSPVHNRPAHVLTPAEQRAAYDQDGYLVFRELLDATELAGVRQRFLHFAVKMRRAAVRRRNA